MELEAENLCIHSASRDFYDEKSSNFSCRKSFSKNKSNFFRRNFSKKSKIWNFHFLNWLSEDFFSKIFRSRKIFFQIEIVRKQFLRKVNLKNENFKLSKKIEKNLRKQVPKLFLKKVFSMMKKYFSSRFFSWSGIYLYCSKIILIFLDLTSFVFRASKRPIVVPLRIVFQ